MTQLNRDPRQVRKGSGSDFAAWLDRETQTCGWSYGELAGRAGLSSANVCDLLTGARRPTWEICVRLSRALKMSPTTVFRQAGLLPPVPETRGELLIEVLETLAMLPEGPVLREATEAIRAVTRQAYRQAQGAATRYEQVL